MPAESVALDIDVNALGEDDIDRVHEIVSDSGFHPHPYDEGAIGGIINYQPFENTEENRELLEQCVNKIASELPDAEVTYDLRKNRDAGRVVGKQCYLTVRTEISGGEKEHTDSGQPSDESRVGAPIQEHDGDSSPDWRASSPDEEQPDVDSD